MTGPRRLVDGDASDFERNLLRSARGARPSEQARRRTVKAVAATVGVLGTGAGGAGTVMASVGISGLLKWGALGVVSATLAIVGAEQTNQPPPPAPAVAVAPLVHARAAAIAVDEARSDAPPRHDGSGGDPPHSGPIATDPPVPAPAAAPPRASAAPVAAPRPQATPASEPPPAAVATTRDTPASGLGAPTSADVPPSSYPSPANAANDAPAQLSPAEAKSLADEVAALDRARQALDAKDADAALRALEQRQKRHGAGRMGPEATLLQVRALVRKGNHAAAAALAQSYLASDPNGPYAARIRAALAATKSSSGQ